MWVLAGTAIAQNHLWLVAGLVVMCVVDVLCVCLLVCVSSCVVSFDCKRVCRRAYVCVFVNVLENRALPCSHTHFIVLCLT